MDETQNPVDAAAAPVFAKALSMAQVGDVTSVEVRADGIFETSNQHDASLRQLSGHESKPADETENWLTNASMSPRELEQNASREPGLPSADGVHEPEVSAVELGGARVENASPSSSSRLDQASGEEPLENASPLAPIISTMAEVPSTSNRCRSPISAATASEVAHHEVIETPRHESASLEGTLFTIHEFLVEKIQENQLSSHAQEIHEFITSHLSDQECKLHFPPLVQRIVAHFSADAHARGFEDVSVDVQSSICLLEQMFLSLGRVSPLQDMYTAEEEAMLEQLSMTLSARSDGSSG